ncbi:180_t:CDS:2, partial [Ambispora leptoticha]
PSFSISCSTSPIKRTRSSAERTMKTALATDSNILQIFLTYQEINGQFKNEQEKRYAMLQNGEPDMTEDNNIITGNKAIGLKTVLHITLGLYINGPLWVSGQRNWKIIRIIEELARAQEMNIRWAVIHIGTLAGNKKRSDVIANINETLHVIQKNQWNIGILLENSASNNCFGATIPDLIDIVNSINQELRFKDKARLQKRIGICFDTQH